MSTWTAAHQGSLSFIISQFTQIHIHWVNDAIQPSHPLLLPSPALNFFQQQGLLQWVGSLHQVAKVLEIPSGLAPILSMNIQGWFPLGFTDLIPLLSKRLSRVFSSITFWSINTTATQPYLWSTFISFGGKTIGLTIWTFFGKVVSLLFNMLSRFVIAFLPRSKRLLISWLQSLSTLVLEPKKIKSVTVSMVSHLFAMKWWDWMPWSSFLNVEC